MSRQPCQCGEPSKGSIGRIRFCYLCAARVLNQTPKALRRRFRFVVTHGRMEIGEAVWVPDAAISREREIKAKGTL